MNAVIDNILYLYFFACIAILNYNSFSKSQKLVLIYISTISMHLFVPIRLYITLGMLLLMMFVIEEYLNPDQEKLHIIRGGPGKTLDFLYMVLFHDAGLWILFTLFLSWGHWRDLCLALTGTSYIYYISILFSSFFTMHRLCSPKLVIKDYKDIIKYFDRFVGKNLNLTDPSLCEKLLLLTELEDHSYFMRENSYNWISMEFLRYKIGKNRQKRTEQQIPSLGKRLRHCWRVLRNSGLFFIIKNIKTKLNNYICLRCYWIRSAIRRIRGGSTLEMQLIRNIAIAEGYNYTMRRKFFELTATSLFFPGLLQYYERKNVAKKNHYKEFILYVYLHSVPVKINGVRFPSISCVLQNANGGEPLPIEEYNVSQLYVAYLALTNAPVTDKRLLLYPDTVLRYGIDLNYAKFFGQLIKDRKITPDRTMKATDVKDAYYDYREKLNAEDTFYPIEYTILPYVENHILYAGPLWPSYGLQNCWQFAQNIYWRIWHESFNSYAGTKDDSLKKVPEGVSRSITAENARKFLRVAVPGAVIRLSDRIKGRDSGPGKHHSQILLCSNDKGSTIYQSTDSGTSIRFFTWEEYAREYQEYKYFKYIKWPKE